MIAHFMQIPVFGCMKTFITIAAVMTMLMGCAPNAREDKPEPKDTIRPQRLDTTPVIYRRYEDRKGRIWYQEETK